MKPPSKNAIAQALKIVKRKINKQELLALIEVPVCFTTTVRYWDETFDIRPWRMRSREERKAALQVAKDLIAAATKK